ncbi:precorrin-3B C17-methyltransferase [Raineyella antarctica]|uniref:Precorrin-3B C17-methyltransferase n=1 Tax=Raineyella antarctica TaxID=1577474 RepID=A0A1G6GFI3_9ACTN|nr:precorrin-3B C(17)-methyltransferase [Raineyella antarctica]SDB79936.1 precorrin-3B C17-methyltransferase [Raineyella antarctica]
MIGHLTNSAAGRRHAAAIDVALGEPTRHYEGPVADSLATAWAECDLLVSHLALGATTRLVAPLLQSKDTDPGVVVVDEAGRFAVPLVGGHGGGANDLARRIADGIGAVAVVTTATDAVGLPALDTLGWAWAGDVAAVTRSILEGHPVDLVKERPWPLPAFPENVCLFDATPTLGADATDRTAVGRVVITERPSAEVLAGADRPTVVLHPRSVVAGMGCHAGTDVAPLRELLIGCLADQHLAPESLAALVSTDVKADEPGLVALAAEFGVPFITYPADVLAAQPVPNPSPVVESHVGSPGVAEAAVLARGADLVREKQRSTVATCALGVLPARGHLSVVGLGPGARDLTTPRAVEAIRDAAVIVGYRPYVDQVRDLVRPGTRVVASGMGTEEERTGRAIEEARRGHAVALVCSGDPAIYAMASPTLEQGTDGIDVEIIPGVTAELAISAILGAPLGHDHVTISLSDLHTDWETIEKRLQAAAEGDFVVTLYNPRSRKRLRHLPRALEILGAHRPGSTPVAAVHDATRPDEQVVTGTLADFDVERVDMNSLVVVGSSTTRLVTTGSGEQRIVTPRDYHWMTS